MVEVHHTHPFLEHAMTPIVVEKLAEFLVNQNFAHTVHQCPEPNYLKIQSLSWKQSRGKTVEVAMIGEVLEDSVDLMKILMTKVMPGKQHKVIKKRK
ncbi:MAG: hypothetical protein Ct9H300mP21_09040 [Pseudomonadota bacterium]|nr:MAG: hypothetical protein Ct9H300mP21_09040 [Pseudomonadota bacterium]